MPGVDEEALNMDRIKSHLARRVYIQVLMIHDVSICFRLFTMMFDDFWSFNIIYACLGHLRISLMQSIPNIPTLRNKQSTLETGKLVISRTASKLSGVARQHEIACDVMSYDIMRSKCPNFWCISLPISAASFHSNIWSLDGLHKVFVGP